jgi:hypothetical protein
MTAEELVARGYRRVSNKYGIVARVDREDWWEALEKHFQQNMPIRNDAETGKWADYYRRGLSKDTLEVGPDIARFVPTSSWDSVGFIASDQEISA